MCTSTVAATTTKRNWLRRAVTPLIDSIWIQIESFRNLSSFNPIWKLISDTGKPPKPRLYLKLTIRVGFLGAKTLYCSCVARSQGWISLLGKRLHMPSRQWRAFYLLQVVLLLILFCLGCKITLIGTLGIATETVYFNAKNNASDISRSQLTEYDASLVYICRYREIYVARSTRRNVVIPSLWESALDSNKSWPSNQFWKMKRLPLRNTLRVSLGNCDASHWEKWPQLLDRSQTQTRGWLVMIV